MRHAATFVLSLTALFLALDTGLAKDPDPPAKTEPMTMPRKKRSNEMILGRTLNQWITVLKDPDPSLRREAIQVVQQYGEDSTDAVPSLVYILSNDPDATLRSCAAVVLMNVEVSDNQVNSVVDALCGQVDGPNKNFQLNVRFHCVVSLGRFENEAQRAIPALIKATKDEKSWEIRQAACYSLVRVFQYPKDHKGQRNYPDSRVYYPLISALSDHASKVRMEALQGLLFYGPATDREVREKLIYGFLSVLNDRERAIQVWAYVGLMRNTDPGGANRYMDALTNLLLKGDVPTRMQAINAFTMLIREIRTTEMKKRLLDIVAIIKDSSNDQALISNACWALVNISEKLGISDDAIAAVKTASEYKNIDPWARESAKNAHLMLTKPPEKPKTDTIAKPDRRP